MTLAPAEGPVRQAKIHPDAATISIVAAILSTGLGDYDELIVIQMARDYITEAERSIEADRVTP